MELKSGDRKKEKNWNHYKQDIRWTLDLERFTPKYIILKETKVEQISIEAGYRALKYQEKIRNSTENRILKECRKRWKARSGKTQDGGKK